jgi:hypothetical protein
MELHRLLDSVNDEESFLTFVEALYRDRKVDLEQEGRSPSSPYGQTARGWQNVTVDSFLEAAHRWAVDTQFGATQNLGTAPPWRKFAAFLYCGKTYE